MWVLALALAWWLPGLLGHDPWKPEEAAAFGVVYGLLQGGSWVDLRLAGEALHGTAPLFYWVCALTAKALGGLLPLHDAARLGAGVFSAGCVLFLSAAARRFCGAGAGIAAFLITLGSVGFIPAAHQMVPGLALLFGYCVTLYGLSRWESTARAAGFWVGLGVGLVHLGAGLAHALALIGALALLPLMFRAWRQAVWKAGLVTALATAAPCLLIWLALLQRQSPALLDVWLNLSAPLSGLSVAAIARNAGYSLGVLTWYGAPAWPLALWTLWSTRRTFIDDRAAQLGVVIFAIAFAVLVFDNQASEGHRLVLLPGLILLAARGIETVRRGAGHALLWFSVMFFLLFALTGWYYWMGFDLGFPERLHRHVTRMQPGYVVSEFILRVGAAVVLCAGWLLVLLRMRRSPARPLLAWTAGATMIWGLLMTLYINYMDTGRSYRSVAQQVRAALPSRHGCVASHGLGESQRAMFHYFGGLLTQRHAPGDQSHGCGLLLVQSQRKTPYRPGEGWRTLYAGTRPGDKNEWYELFVKAH